MIVLDGIAQFILPLAYVIGAAGIAWYIFMVRHRSQMKVMSEKRAPYAIINSIPREEWIMRRPMEFGPIHQPRERIDAIRDAIVEDQLGARKESPAQRRRRMQRYRGYTDRQRVQHWLLHWREDSMAALTGRSLAWE